MLAPGGGDTRCPCLDPEREKILRRAAGTHGKAMMGVGPIRVCDPQPNVAIIGMRLAHPFQKRSFPSKRMLRFVYFRSTRWMSDNSVSGCPEVRFLHDVCQVPIR